MSPSLSLSLISFLPVKSGGIALGSLSSYLYLANNHSKVSSCLSQRPSRFSRPIAHLALLGTCLLFPFFVPGIGISADGAPNTPKILALMSRVSGPGNVQASPPLAGGDPTTSNDASAM